MGNSDWMQYLLQQAGVRPEELREDEPVPVPPAPRRQWLPPTRVTVPPTREAFPRLLTEVEPAPKAPMLTEVMPQVMVPAGRCPYCRGHHREWCPVGKAELIEWVGRWVKYQ